MKKYLKIIIPVFAITLLLILSFKVISKIQQKEQIAENIKNIPAFSFKSLSGSDFTNQDLWASKPSIFIYFKSECDYCENEAQEIKINQRKLNNTQVIFVSNESQNLIQDFAEKYKLTEYDNIHFLFDERDNFAEIFGATSVPYILIYNGNDELVKRVIGQTKVSVILEALKKR